jgi:hypothetical protein
VTELVRRTLLYLPDDGARRILQILRAHHILVHAEDLPPARRTLPGLLAAQPEHYQRIFQQGPHSVFTLSLPDDPSLALLDTPALPAHAQPVPQRELRAHSNLNPKHLGRAMDGNPQTYWSAGRRQARGQYFEIELSQPRPVVALELETHPYVMQVPLSYELSASQGASDWRIVAQQPVLRLYREQVFSPKNFVFRIVLPKPALADHIRITISQPLPGHHLVIHEARIHIEEP